MPRAATLPAQNQVLLLDWINYTHHYNRNKQICPLKIFNGKISTLYRTIAYRGHEPSASEGCSPSYCHGEPAGTSLHPRQRTLHPRSSASSEKNTEILRSRLLWNPDVKEHYSCNTQHTYATVRKLAFHPSLFHSIHHIYYRGVTQCRYLYLYLFTAFTAYLSLCSELTWKWEWSGPDYFELKAGASLYRDTCMVVIWFGFGMIPIFWSKPWT